MVKAYAVNCNDAWLIPDDEPKEGHYVKYEDYAKPRGDAKKLATLLFKSVKGEELTDREKAAGMAFLCNGELND